MIALLCMMATADAGLLQISGFVSPQFTGVVRPDAVPEDRLTAGLSATRAGITFQGEPDERWAFKTYLLVGGDTFAALTSVAAVDTNNDGSVDRIAATTAGALGQIVREASVHLQPHRQPGHPGGPHAHPLHLPGPEPRHRPAVPPALRAQPDLPGRR